MKIVGFLKALFLLVLASLFAGLASIFQEGRDNILISLVFVGSLILLIIAFYDPKKYDWAAFAFATGVYMIASLILFYLALAFAESPTIIPAVLAFPVEKLGYYPPGPDVPLIIGYPLWVGSMLILIALPFGASLVVGTLTGRHRGRQLGK
jgi:hypothetical protein